VQLSFNLDQAVTGERLRFGGLRAEVATTPRAFENFDLFVNAAEKHGGLTLEAQYNTDLFDRATVERWMAEYETLLRSALAAPGAPLGALEARTAAERALVDAWNAASARAYPADETAADLLAAGLARTPERTALVAADAALTYAELDARSAALAAELRARGVGRGSLVGVALGRSSRLPAAVLGVLRSGAAYVPLDPAFPRERLAFMAGDAGLALLVSERALAAELPAPEVARLFLDDVDPAPAAGPAAGLAPDRSRDARADDPAYVIYTSGSTGTPKGVAVPHRAVANFLRAMAESPGLTADARLLAVTTLSFDIAVLELLLPLTVGARVVLATASEAADGAALRRLIAAHDVNVLQATPSTWRLLLAAGERFGAGFTALCGGEALPLALARELLATGLALWNVYGPTETTVWSACRRVRAEDARVRVGGPIANTRLHVVDGALRPLPLGVAGELCIGGAGVALGYLGRPELTAEKFVPDPFGPGTLYRTGDLARWLPDGTVEVLGRADGQVKVRGHRIELGEIEAVLGRHPGVRQAVVLAREDRPGDQRLAAYVVPEGPMPADDALRTHLRRLVPEYMVPQHFVELGALPLTPNGKVDRKRLPAPEAAAAPAGGAFADAETASERLLQAVWQRVLGLPRVSATDDFFALGGHSLLAAQAAAQVAREAGVELSMRRLFEAPTVRALARVLDEALAAGAAGAAPIPRLPAGAPAPASLQQRRVWLLEELSPGTAVYNLPSSFRLRGRLDPGALRRALDAIAERHAAVRTAVRWADGELRQEVRDELRFDLTPVDLRAVAPGEREAALRALLAEEAARPFDLARGPLARASLYLLADDESVLFFMPHHAVWDGWSFDVFLDELDRLYAAFARGEPSPLAPLAVSYADYAAWQQRWLESDELERQAAYWTERLAGELPVLELPADRPRPAHLTYAGATVPFALDAELVARLTEVGRRRGATFFMVLLAAYDVLLHRLSGQTDLVVGTPMRGRTRPELEPLLGFFVNALPLRTRVDPGERFGALLDRVRATSVEAFEHQDMPFELLVERLAVPRDPSRTPIYSAFFTFQDVRNRQARVGDLTYEQIHVHAPASPADLSLWVKQGDARLVGGLDFATDLFEPETARRWVAAYEELLRGIAEDSERPVGDLPLLSADARAALLAASPPPTTFPDDAYLHQLVERQADRTPDAAAVRADDGRLTYAELDARANRLARVLAARGAGPGTRVGICLERTSDLLVAALAVQKTGAAYVPLDPAFPAERLRFMAEDAGLAALVVHARTRDAAPAAPGARLVDLDADADAVAAADPARPPAPAVPSAEAPAYVIYTSGSTGTPKGVVVPHRAAANFVTSVVREPGLAPGDRLLAVTTLSFDIAVLELYAPLVAGAEVVIAGRETARDGDLLDEALEEHGVTVMQATPATWRVLLASGWRGGPRFKALCGGEPFPRDLAERLLAAAGGGVWNLYGPTETTVWSTMARLERPLGEITIGRPLANTLVYVVDAAGRLAPWGAPGELWIGGAGVALGYHARPELTAERFLANPFGPGRVYRTGDLVRLTAGGELRYVGRNDDQIKLRGYRIELGEIEAALARVPGVRQAAAAVRGTGDDRQLVAYLTGEPGSAADDAELRRALRVALPEYMIPRHFVRLDAMPLTPNGKVDRKALPAPAGGGAPAAGAGYVAPSTPDERLLAELWQEVLGVARVGARDNFFELGGHSLLCLQMTARLAERTGRRLSPRVVLRNDLSQIAALLPTLGATPPPAAAPSSFAQRLLAKLRSS
jgi:amino acid adenylation domain-containing protein